MVAVGIDIFQQPMQEVEEFATTDQRQLKVPGDDN
jgi:hypothetical protein